MKLFKKIKCITVAAAIAGGFLSAAIMVPTPAYAQFKNELCGGASLKLSPEECKDKGEQAERSLNRLIESIVNIISVIVGILAVIFIIIGGAKYITSGGDAGKVSSAKTTVIYAIVGLIIVALAQFIVRFVLTRV